jgi:hypothetical protein
LAVFGFASLVAGRELAAGLGLSLSSVNEPEFLTSDPELSDDPAAVAPRGNWSVEDAKNFRDFPVFWAGEEHAGVPLEAIIRADYVSAVRPQFTLVEDSVSFLYGSCIPSDSGEGGCPNPYQVIVQSACMVPPGFASRDHVDTETTVRGAHAEVFTDGHLILWTQNVAVTIFAPTREETVSVADRLVPLNSSARLAGDEFMSATPTNELACPADSPAMEVVGHED